MYNPLDPLNPFGIHYDPMPDKKMTDEERDEYMRQHIRMALHTIAVFFLAIVVLGIISALTSCSTSKSTTTERTDHRLTETAIRTDTVYHDRIIYRQDSSWRQDILRQFQSLRESSDTSRYVVADTAGKIISERIIITNNRETASTSDRQQLTVLTSRLEQMDSTMRTMEESLQRNEALLNDRQQVVTTTVTTPLSLWQTIQMWVGRLAMIALAVLAAVWLIRHRSWLLTIIRKLIK